MGPSSSKGPSLNGPKLIKGPITKWAQAHQIVLKRNVVLVGSGHELVGPFVSPRP